MPAPSLPNQIYFSSNLGGRNNGNNLGNDYTETIDV